MNKKTKTDIHNNYIKLMDGKNVNKGIGYIETEDTKKIHNASIHENYVKLMDGKIINNSTYQETETTKILHNADIHTNYIKLMNSGYKTRNIKSSEDEINK